MPAQEANPEALRLKPTHLQDTQAQAPINRQMVELQLVGSAPQSAGVNAIRRTCGDASSYRIVSIDPIRG